MKASKNTPLVSRKMAHFAESAIRDMSQLADEIGAINLAQGSPDFPSPIAVKRAGAKAIMDDFNQYEMTVGSPQSSAKQSPPR